MRIIFLFAATLFFISDPAQATIEMGLGYSSATTGHTSPALILGLGAGDWAMTGSSTGYQTTAYYHSSYTLNYYWTWGSGDFFWGKLESGFGIGTLYAIRGFTDQGSTEETKSDFNLGPAFRLKWIFLDPVFISLEALFGLRDLTQHLALNAQDSINLSLGVAAW